MKIVYLECVLMDQGELISLGKSLGWKNEFEGAIFDLRDKHGNALEGLGLLGRKGLERGHHKNLRQITIDEAICAVKK